MKLFDIEKAKAGAKLCTRDGRPARVICWDRKGTLPIVVLIMDKTSGNETSYYYDENGCSNFYEDLDLFLAPVKEEGWVNVYKDMDGCYSTRKVIHCTKEDALQGVASEDYIATVRIEWEE